MIASDDKISEIVYAAIDEVNTVLRREQRLSKSMETVLSGGGSALDSLGLVNLIVAVERKLENELGTTVVLADERAMSQAENPLRTVASLVGYISTLTSS